MKSLIAIFTLALIASACTSDDDLSPPQHSNPTNELRLNDLRVGQSNKFLAYQIFCTPSGNFEYTGDTLIAEVVAFDGGLGIRESYTPGSPNHTETPAVTYPVIPEDGYLLLPQRALSQLFYFFGNDTLPVEKPYDVILQQNDCYIEYLSGDPFTGDEVGLILQISVHDHQYVEKRVVSCVPIFMNLDGYLVYDSQQLFSSIAVSAGLIGPVSNGYVVIPNN